MTALPDEARDKASRSIVLRYFVAMAAPFGIDLVSSIVYAAINEAPQVLLPTMAVSATFLILGTGVGAYLLIRPITRFLAGQVDFPAVENTLSHLPRNSALLVGSLYAPLQLLRLISARSGVTFGADIDVSAPPDAIASFVVGTSFNIVLTFFVVSAYLDQLCEYLFDSRGVNLGTFRGTFRRKVGVAVLFVSFAAMILLSADIMSYSGARLVREATVDITASVVGAATVYFWISRALTAPIHRLAIGMRLVAEGDFQVRLPVTSNDEVGRATSGFNQMVEGLSERQYLRDTFGKYVSESVATAVLDDHDRAGRVVDTTAEATLMFTDIEGFTGLSEGLSPTEVAAVLNAYLATVVPVIQRHGGVVNSFIGDGLFASFNLPQRREGHAAAALMAALEIQQALARATFAAGIDLRTRIGINTGPVIGVTIGAADRLSYTLLGDAVNIASRVEQLNKRFGTSVLATESTIQAAGPGIVCVRLGETGIRGHRGDVVVYSIDCAA
jgi:class 3 adenylate cyclase